MSAAAFAAIGIAALTGHLTIPGLAVLVFVAGAVTTLSLAGSEAFMPSLVPRHQLGAAYVAEAQMGQAANSLGPLLAGALVRLVSAPVAILLNAATFAVSALCTGSIVRREPRPSPSGQHVLRDVRDGARWVYGHRMLRPYAASMHLWFVGYAVLASLAGGWLATQIGNHAALMVAAAIMATSALGLTLSPFRQA